MKNKAAFVAVCFLLFPRGHFSYARDMCPYSIDGYVSLSSESAAFKYAGMNITFYNKTGKDIKRITFNFFLYDEDGNPPFPGNNCITVDCVQAVKAYDTVDFCVSLDEYMVTVPDEPYQTDFLYAGRIEYEDGTVWEDPYGLYVME
ncbi:MAG TPA: hypothetical protein DCL73_14025 [Treponema sp.]|nr:hypothetical protein [Treponema sp.]